MKLETTTKPVASVKADAIIVFVCKKYLKHDWVAHKKALEVLGFKGKSEQTAFIPGDNVLYVGVEEAGDPATLRDAAAAAVRSLQKTTCKSAVVGHYGKKKEDGLMAAMAEGFLLGAYGFDKYKSEKEPSALAKILFSTESCYGEKASSTDLKRELETAAVIAAGVNLTRDIVNTMPDEATPDYLAAQAQIIAKENGLECSVYDETYLKEQGMNAFLMVNRASVHPPRLIHLAYKPKKAKARVVLVGKGLTYDSGGLSLKPSDYMVTMKADKSGASAVLGIMSAVAKLGLEVEVHGVCGATENMIGGDAYKPDDILTAKNGKTIEVRNTDAEGRLVLADCLCWAQDELKPDYIADMATLTGACVVALGEYTTGVMGHNDKLKSSLVKAAEEGGELAAPLPFNKHLKKLIKSEIADVSNIGSSRYGGAITAALFLSEFIQEKYRDKWVHLDIAGPAYVEKSWGCNPHGASGAGVRMILKWLANLK